MSLNSHNSSYFPAPMGPHQQSYMKSRTKVVDTREKEPPRVVEVSPSLNTRNTPVEKYRPSDLEKTQEKIAAYASHVKGDPSVAVSVATLLGEVLPISLSVNHGEQAKQVIYKARNALRLFFMRDLKMEPLLDYGIETHEAMRGRVEAITFLQDLPSIPHLDHVCGEILNVLNPQEFRKAESLGVS